MTNNHSRSVLKHLSLQSSYSISSKFAGANGNHVVMRFHFQNCLDFALNSICMCKFIVNNVSVIVLMHRNIYLISLILGVCVETPFNNRNHINLSLNSFQIADLLLKERVPIRFAFLCIKVIVTVFSTPLR